MDTLQHYPIALEFQRDYAHAQTVCTRPFLGVGGYEASDNHKLLLCCSVIGNITGWVLQLRKKISQLPIRKFIQFQKKFFSVPQKSLRTP